MTERWLSLIGLGEDGALSPPARALVNEATLIIGGARHLALIGATEAAQMQWPSPFASAMDAIVARRGAATVDWRRATRFFTASETLSRGASRARRFSAFRPLRRSRSLHLVCAGANRIARCFRCTDAPSSGSRRICSPGGE